MIYGPYAMIANNTNLVLNTIVVDADFSLDGYYFIEIKENVFCQLGMYYDSVSGLFYDDEEFTLINGIAK